MAKAFNILYGDMVFATLQARRGLLSRFNQMFELGDPSAGGSVTATLLDQVTSSTIVDGTVQTNDMNQTQVALTLVDKAATLSLRPKEAKSSLAKPANIAIMAKGGADAIAKGAQEQVIVDFVAGTPGITDTLAVGQIDFTTDGGADEAFLNLAAYQKVLIQCFNRMTNAGPDSFTAIMSQAALANFSVLRATAIQSPTLGPDGVLMWQGVPHFSFNYATNWGAAGNDCTAVLNNQNYAMRFESADLWSGEPLFASDVHVKWITVGTYVHGIILDDHMGTIVNPAS